MDTTKKKEQKRKWLIILLCLLLAICIGVTVWALFFRDSGTPPITPDYPPQGTEQNQKPLEGDEGDKIDSPEGGGAINVTYGTAVTVDLSENKVTLLYANPQASNQNVAILIMIDDLVVAKSDQITPGYGVDTLPLEEYAKERLAVGGYDGELVIRAYDPETGEKAMVDTKGEITITVVE